MSDRLATKNTLRRKYTRQRGAVAVSVKKRAERVIARHIVESDFYQTADKLLLYAAYGSEASVNQVALQGLKDGKDVCFGKCIDGFTLEFRRIVVPEQLKRGMYGILEPDTDCPLVTDFTGKSLCLVPAIAYDTNGYRLGHGKGYYDRFLSTFPGMRVGVCLNELLIEGKEWEYDRFDVAVTDIVTENGFYHIG